MATVYTFPKVGKFRFGAASLAKLKLVHPDLQAVCHYAIRITDQDFGVFEGLRTIERQKMLVGRGSSKTMNSRHIPGLAVDNVPWTDGDHDGDMEFVWSVPLCTRISRAMLIAASSLSVQIQWGADWDSDGDTQDETWRDYPHFQLNPSVYPNKCLHVHRSKVAAAFMATLAA